MQWKTNGMEEHTMKDYSGKVVVITGGTSGLGFALASLLGKAGATVLITGRREEKGREALEKLQAEGINATYFQQDVTEPQSWADLAKKILQQEGRIDYAFNNAGVMARPKSAMELPLEDWNWVLDTNLYGVLYGLRTFTGMMLKQENGGTIVTTSSTGAIAPFSMWGPYSVSKAASTRLVETFAGEMKLGKITKIHYSVVLPGVFESDIANSTLHRPSKYARKPGEEDKPMPVSKAHTPDGDKLGMITAEETAKALIEGMEKGLFYIYPHEDLSMALLPEQFKAMRNEEATADQAIFDFAFYAKKLKAQGIDAGASNLQNMSQDV